MASTGAKDPLALVGATNRCKSSLLWHRLKPEPVLMAFFGWHLKGAQSHPFSTGWSHELVLKVFF
jgi:hypothetical protein